MHSKLYSAVDQVIGNTPLVALDRITQGLEGRILAKLDYLNPGFSKKDRPARQLIDDAETSGALKPGQTVVELTSGNMGTGLAIVCAVRGYPFVAVMSEGNSVERARMMRALGAEVILVPQAPGAKPGEVSGDDLALVEQETRKITEQRNAFRADQFGLAGGWRAHYLHTAPEIWSQSDGSVDVFCDFIGSGGTYAGCTKYFKEQNPATRCYAVEPEGAAVLAGDKVNKPDHPIQGGGYAIADLSMMQDVPVDGHLRVTGDEAMSCARALARTEGIFAGFSAGANLAAALQLLRGPEQGKTIAIIMCDSGLKYLSTNLWP